MRPHPLLPLLLTLSLAACSPAGEPEEGLSLFPPSTPPATVGTTGSIEFDDIIDVEDTGRGLVVPTQTTAIFLESMEVRYQFTYTSTTAPPNALCLDLAWYAAWGSVAGQLFGNPEYERFTLLLSFTRTSNNTWVATGQRTYTRDQLSAFENWLNTRPSTDDRATLGGRGNLRDCQQTNQQPNLSGSLKVNRLRTILTRRQANSIDWNISAEDLSLQGRNNETFAFRCIPGGKFHLVWGSDIYTDDSSICTAAVHAGRISQQQGGTIAIRILPGQEFYAGSIRNGVESQQYGSWPGSFSVE
jgi:hypothetical protein